MHSTLKSIGLGIVVTAVLALVAAPFALAQEAEYVGNKTCKMCHNKKDEGAQWTKWSEMGHKKALETLKSEESVALGKELGLEKPPSEAPECLKCHVTGYDVEAKKAPAKIVPDDGIQCESCHGASSLHLADAKAHMKDKSIDLTKNHHLADEAICVKCHNAESPTWKEDRYTKEDGTKVGFDFEQAAKKIAHPNPKKADE